MADAYVPALGGEFGLNGLLALGLSAPLFNDFRHSSVYESILGGATG